MRCTVGEIRGWANEAKAEAEELGVSTPGEVFLPAEVVLQLVGGFVQAHGVSDDYEVGE